MRIKFIRIGLLAVVLLATLFVLTPKRAYAQTIIWNGSSSTDWNTAANWTPARVPTSDDDVVIGNFVPGSQPTLGANTMIQSLTINGRSATKDTRGGCLTINTGVTLTITGNLAINGSTDGPDSNVHGVTCNGTVRTGITTNGTGSLIVGGNVTFTAATGGPPEPPFISMSSGTLSVGGNWTNNSATTAFVAGTSTVIFNGITQAIGGSSATTFSTLTIANGSTTTANIAPTVTTFNINDGGKYIQTDNSGIVPGTTRNFGASSTYEWRTGGGVTFPSASGISFGNLVINTTSGNNSAAGNLTTVNGNLQVVNTTGGSYRLAATTSPTVNISGNLIVDGGTLNFSSGTGAPTVNVAGSVQLNGGTLQPAVSTGVPIFNVGGNWTNNGGTFTPGTGTVAFNGSAAQTIGGSSATTFNNLTLNNANGAALNANVTVNGTLALTSGNLTAGTGTNRLTLGCSATVTSTGGGNVIGDVVRTCAFVAGTTYTFNEPNTSITFASGGTLPSSITVSLVKTKPSQFVTAIPRTYIITPTGGSGYSATLRLQYASAELGGMTEANLKLWRHNGTRFVLQGGTQNNGDGTNRYVSLSGVTQFSSWAIAENNAVTAVTLSSFHASSQPSPMDGWLAGVAGMLLVGGGGIWTLHRRRQRSRVCDP